MGFYDLTAEKLNRVFTENGDAAFFEKMVMLAKNVIIDSWRKDGVLLPDDRMEMFFAFIINGSIALIGKWAADDMKNTPAEVAELIERAAYGGINGMIDSK